MPALTDDQIKQIVVLYETGLGAEMIARRLSTANLKIGQKKVIDKLKELQIYRTQLESRKFLKKNK